ncbi:hypothetical protein [Sorangium cellulosum]|uniref:DUF4384 domain-containing protein n=1 Tax=Sorangium cellulosum So0157-2 TaxID=1254432 RepID=S4Y6G7_SORCE|nr:hypothetical protein [Sorangium cellulosum]AGP40439.1 hypothetical protein SCE1572_41605 [Sorangium cellulosum So0157-2]
MTPARPDGCLSDLKIDELMAGQLDAAAAQEANAHLAGCPRCAARRAGIEAERAAFAAAAPPLQLGPSRRDRRAPAARTAASSRSPRRWLLPAAASTLAAAAAAALFFRAAPHPREVVSPGERIKGAERLGFYVKRGEQVLPGGAGERLLPGDALQFTTTSAEARYLAILSVDGASQASVYYPSGPLAERVEPGRDVPLPQSTVLDDTLGTERIYGLFCAEAITVEPLRAALAANPDALSVPPGCDVDMLTAEKVAGSP